MIPGVACECIGRGVLGPHNLKCPVYRRPLATRITWLFNWCRECGFSRTLITRYGPYLPVFHTCADCGQLQNTLDI